MNWADNDIEKMKSAYLEGLKKTVCPACGGHVSIEKQEGKEYLKKKYVNTHFFLIYACDGCGRKDLKQYKKSPYVT